jgi:hypothetical protein
MGKLGTKLGTVLKYSGKEEKVSRVPASGQFADIRDKRNEKLINVNHIIHNRLKIPIFRHCERSEAIPLGLTQFSGNTSEVNGHLLGGERGELRKSYPLQVQEIATATEAASQ